MTEYTIPGHTDTTPQPPAQQQQQEPKWYHFVRRGEDCFVPYEGQAPADATRLYTTPQPQAHRKPLTPEFEADTGYSRDERAAFTAGWEAAEAAHGITKGGAA
jgi:hypothetical protein